MPDSAEHPEHDHDHHDPSKGDRRSTNSLPPPLLIELREHIPFSMTAVALGLIVAGTICIIGLDGRSPPIHPAEAGHAAGHASDPTRLFFHLFHPAHMLFSAAATAAMFSRYEHKIAKAVVVGMIGSVGICGVSDIAIPHLSLWILNVHTPLHICVVQHPDLVLPFAVVGVAVGIASSGGRLHTTIVSHSLHVLTSTMASIFYMIGPLGVTAWIDRIGELFVFVSVAVLVPCCLSDIVFPMLMSNAGQRQYHREGAHAH